MELERDFFNQMLTNNENFSIPDKDDIKSKATVKIKLSNGQGTGCFIKFERNKKPFYCLATNQHVLKPKVIQNKETISLYDNSERLIKEIKLDSKERIILCFMENLKIDVTLVEIIPKDKIINQAHFLSPYITNDIFNPHQFITRDIEVFQYPDGGEQFFSKGKICGIYPESDKILIHNCNTNDGSSGGPIFLSGDQRVFAIHKGVYKPIKENAGIFINTIVNY